MKLRAKFEVDQALLRGLKISPQIVQSELTTALRGMVEHVIGEAERRAPGSLAKTIQGEVKAQQGIVGSTDFRAGWLEEGVTILPMGKRGRGKALAVPQTKAAARLQRGLKGNQGLRGVPGLFIVPKGGGKAVILHRDDPNLRWTLLPVVRIRPRHYLRDAEQASRPTFQREIDAAGKRIVNRLFGGSG